MTDNNIRHFIAGALRIPGTTILANVTGDCPHHHRTAESAARCIAAHDTAIKRGHGPHAYSDRKVIAIHADGRRLIVAEVEQ